MSLSLRRNASAFEIFARLTSKNIFTLGRSQKVDTQEDFTQLVLLEEFNNCLPEVIQTYLKEQK